VRSECHMPAACRAQLCDEVPQATGIELKQLGSTRNAEPTGLHNSNQDNLKTYVV